MNNDCGCNGPQLIKESKGILLSEGMQYHIANGVPLLENIYRPLSANYFALFQEARTLYNNSLLSVTEEDAELLESNIGEYGIHNGIKVPLDYPISLDELIDLHESLDENNKNTHNIIISFTDQKLIDKFKSTPTFSKMLAPNQMKDLKVGDNKVTVNNVALNGLERMASTGLYSIVKNLSESKDKKKNPPIGKPKRGGSKKFYVYVKDKGKIKKVSFGDTTGLRAKLNNPKARKAFSARHDCPNKKDRTKASYWSCRLPRYAKLLGFKTTFSGYW
jgi:hypothetical protein